MFSFRGCFRPPGDFWKKLFPCRRKHSHGHYVVEFLNLPGSNDLPFSDRHIISRSEEETLALGREFAAMLRPPDCVALSGELGSGKTQFVRGMCDHFSCADQVTSPTFTIMNEYRGTATLVHCDLYRLESPGEIFDAGVLHVFDEASIVIIEWAEKAAHLLPLPRWEILFEHGESASERTIHMHHCLHTPESVLSSTLPRTS